MDAPIVTVHNIIKRPVIKLETKTSSTQDPILECWKFIFDNWYCTEWQPIPDWVRQKIKFHPQLGMCSGNLVTRNGAKGMNEFLLRINRKEN